MIDRLLAGETTFADFDGTFGMYYYEHLPVDVMRSAAAAFVSRVVETLEFTMSNPSAHDRAEGWMGGPEFVEWLRQERQKTHPIAAG